MIHRHVVLSRPLGRFLQPNTKAKYEGETQSFPRRTALRAVPSGLFVWSVWLVFHRAHTHPRSHWDPRLRGGRRRFWPSECHRGGSHQREPLAARSGAGRHLGQHGWRRQLDARVGHRTVPGHRRHHLRAGQSAGRLRRHRGGEFFLRQLCRHGFAQIRGRRQHLVAAGGCAVCPDCLQRHQGEWREFGLPGGGDCARCAWARGTRHQYSALGPAPWDFRFARRGNDLDPDTDRRGD